MGNNKSTVGLLIQTQKQFYLPGDVIQGSIYINSPQPYPCSRILLNIQGVQLSWWKGNAEENAKNIGYNRQRPNQSINVNDQYKGEGKIIQTNFIICAWNNESFVHGQYAFPFVFRLPFHIPGSFSETKPNYRASIGYKIRGLCISPKPNFKHIECVQQLIIREPQKSNQSLLYGQIFVYPRSCCFRRHGVTKVSCYFEKNYYMPGEQCVAICQVDNFKGSLPLRQVKCEFIKSITLTSFKGDERVFSTVINSIEFPGAQAHGQYTGENAVRKPIPLKYKNSDIVLHPSTDGRYVKCEYYIMVTPIFNGICVSNLQTFSVKLNILQPGLIIPKIEEPANWNPQQFKRSQIILNNHTQNTLMDSMIQE